MVCFWSGKCGRLGGQHLVDGRNLGLCQIGGVDFECIRHLFDLKESQVFLHALLGGRVAQVDTPDIGTHSEEPAVTRTDAVQKWEEGSI